MRNVRREQERPMNFETETQASRVKTNRRLLALLSLGHLVTDMNQGALPALLPFLRAPFDLSYTSAGVIILVANLTSSVIQPLFGYLSDRKAIRLLLPWGVLLSAIGFGFSGIAPSYALLLLLVSLAGVGVAAYHPEGYKSAHQVAGSKKASGLSFFTVGGNFGLALGPPAITLLISLFGLPGTLGLLGPGALIAAALALALPALASVKPESEHAASKTESRKPMRWAIALLVVVVILRSWSQLGLVSFIPFYYVDVLKSDPRLVGPLLFVFLASGAVGTLVGGAFADRWGIRRYIILSLLTAAPLTGAFLVLGGWLAFLMLAIVGFTLVSTFSLTVVLAQRYLPRSLGMASGLTVGFAIGTGGIGVAILGWVADHYGLHFTLALTAIMPLVASGLASLLPEEQ
jgi:FSR family fosmidomycin resistance protein-like MFS transporter